MNEEDKLVASIVKGIAYTENGGKLDLDNPVSGKTGEARSIFQFTPDTWKQYSKDAFGKDMPLNPDNETYVVKHKVSKWVKEGKTARQIASMWNAGPGEPDAYTGKFSNGSSSVGVNKKYGVKFDVPSYADKVLNYSKKFYQEKIGPKTAEAAPLESVMTTMKQAQKSDRPMGLIQGLLSKKVNYGSQGLSTANTP